MLHVSKFQNVNIYIYKELRSAIKDFSRLNFLGQGGFGAVFKVITVV